MVNLLIPFYRFRVSGASCSELLVDAYFIKSVEFPPRRVLLLMPGRLIGESVVSGGRVVNPLVSPDDAVSLIRDTFRFLSGFKLPSIQSRLLRSRLSLTLPPKGLRVSVEEGDVRGALLVCGRVFGDALRSPESVGFSLQSLVRLGVDIDLRVFEWGGRVFRFARVRGPKPLPRVYEYLYRVDEGFKSAVNSLLGVE